MPHCARCGDTFQDGEPADNRLCYACEELEHEEREGLRYADDMARIAHWLRRAGPADPHDDTDAPY